MAHLAISGILDECITAPRVPTGQSLLSEQPAHCHKCCRMEVRGGRRETDVEAPAWG